RSLWSRYRDPRWDYPLKFLPMMFRPPAQCLRRYERPFTPRAAASTTILQHIRIPLDPQIDRRAFRPSRLFPSHEFDEISQRVPARCRAIHAQAHASVAPVNVRLSAFTARQQLRETREN